MADKVLVNLATGVEDGERVLVATAAHQQGKEVVVWATKDAVRLGLPGDMSGVVCKDCPPLERLAERFLCFLGSFARPAQGLWDEIHARHPPSPAPARSNGPNSPGRRYEARRPRTTHHPWASYLSRLTGA